MLAGLIKQCMQKTSLTQKLATVACEGVLLKHLVARSLQKSTSTRFLSPLVIAFSSVLTVFTIILPTLRSKKSCEKLLVMLLHDYSLSMLSCVPAKNVISLYEQNPMI